MDIQVSNRKIKQDSQKIFTKMDNSSSVILNRNKDGKKTNVAHKKCNFCPTVPKLKMVNCYLYSQFCDVVS